MGCDEIVSCGVVLFRWVRGVPRYLLIRNAKYGHWDFPKGHVAPGEEERETAIREAEEETGLKGPRLLPGFREVIRYRVREGGRERPKRVIYFLAESRHSRATLSAEHSESRWCSYDEAVVTLQFQNARRLLRKANRFLEAQRERGAR